MGHEIAVIAAYAAAFLVSSSARGTIALLGIERCGGNVDPSKSGEWWNGGWQRRGKSEWEGEKTSNFRPDDRGRVTLNEPSEGAWVDDPPSRYTLTIYTAAPGTPLKSTPNEPSAAGHMWFAITERKADGADKEKSYGFGPNEHGMSGPGHVATTDGDEYIDPYYARTIEITKQQYEKLLDFGNTALKGEDKYFSLYYNGASNSCIDFTNSALRFAGLNPIRSKALRPTNPDPYPTEDKEYEGALKVLDNIPEIKNIPAPSPNSELNGERYNKMPKRTVLQHLLSQQNSVPVSDKAIV